MLIVAIAVSILVLFLRGFKFNNFKNQLMAHEIETPPVKVWLLQSQPYSEKMQAYKAGVISSNSASGIYVNHINNQWYWVAGAYMTQDEAENAKKSNNFLKDSTCFLYEIEIKKLKFPPDAVEPCSQIFDAVKKVIELLNKLRTNVLENLQDGQTLLELTNNYNVIKSKAEELQKINCSLKSDLIACVIYMANVNILGLHDIVCGNNQISLSTINTALLKTIFSVDNF